jgi:hypothetical protein
VLPNAGPYSAKRQQPNCPGFFFEPLPSGLEFELTVKPDQWNPPNGRGAHWHRDDTGFTSKVTNNITGHAASTIVVKEHFP